MKNIVTSTGNEPQLHASLPSRWEVTNAALPIAIATGFMLDLGAQYQNAATAPDASTHTANLTRAIGGTIAGASWALGAVMETVRVSRLKPSTWNTRFVQNTLLTVACAGYAAGAYALGNDAQGSDAALGTWALGVATAYSFLYAEKRTPDTHDTHDTYLNYACRKLNAVDEGTKGLIGLSLYEMSAILLTHDMITYAYSAYQGDDKAAQIGSTGKVSAIALWHAHAVANFVPHAKRLWQERVAPREQQQAVQSISQHSPTHAARAMKHNTDAALNHV